MENIEDEMIGKKFNRWTVLAKCEDSMVCPSGSKHTRYLCECECGKRKKVLKNHLLDGTSKSCGCFKKKNRPTDIHTRLYTIWGNMVNRCTNPNNPAYANYGGRGINVCDQWRNFHEFKKWSMNNGYDDSLSIDRINNDDGYNPENCRWADCFVQSNNTRRNRWISYDGESHTVGEWSKILNIPYKDLHARIQRGWSIDRAFNQPLRKSCK